MKFNQKALEEKKKHLDEIKQHPEYIQEVVSKYCNSEFELEEVPRRWTGGGGTLYLIKTEEMKYFLKVKHREVTVESKLEEESDYIEESCVEHEYYMLRKSKDVGVDVPNIIFYEEYKDFQFLVTEYIEHSLLECLENVSVEQILKLWSSLSENVYRLFSAGMVHADIHEYNIRCRDQENIVLIDFEESREIIQNGSFEESLDYLGTNGISALGEFPLCNQQEYSTHVNSMIRMHEVFEKYIAKALAEYVSKCNYDFENGICVALDHGKSEKTYQSINNRFFVIDGQRAKRDERPILAAKLCETLFENKCFTFVDIGSNNGLFGREISKYFNGEVRCVGLEGYSKFNILARGLAFLENCSNIDYYDFLCGEDNIDSIGLCTECFITVCSVWHHIQHKEEFLRQLCDIKVRYILFELAFQKECYNGRSWKEEIGVIKEKLGFNGEIVIGRSRDYKRPLVLIAKDVFSSEEISKIQELSSNYVF